MTEPRIRSRIMPWLAFGVVLYALFLAVSAPASVAGWAVARASQGKILFEGTRDGFWRGKADSVVISIGTQSQRFSRLAWTFDARSLLRGELSVELRLDDPLAHGQSSLGVRPGSLRLGATALEIAFAALAPHVPLLEIANLRGKLSLRTDNLVFQQDKGVAGTADLEWKNAGSGLSPLQPLGSYRAKVEGAGNKAQLMLVTQEGVLQLAGRGTWARETGVRFDGTARASPGREAELRDLLRLMGPETSSGVHALRF